MKYVIDASVAFQWVVAEPDSPKAMRAWFDAMTELGVTQPLLAIYTSSKNQTRKKTA